MSRRRNPYATDDRPRFRHFIYAFLAVQAVLFPLSGFRAWRQVYDVKLTAASSAPIRGNRIVARVITSGRIGITLELVARQGQNVVQLASKTIPSNEQAIYDPRPRHDSVELVLSDEILERFSPGPITIIATATGRMQFTRMPPPVVGQITLQ